MKGSITRRNGIWGWRADIGDDPVTGKRRQRAKSGYEKRAHAEAALNQFLVRVWGGTVDDEEKLTVGAWLDQWLATSKRRLDHATWVKYEYHTRLYLKPYLGHILLRDLRLSHVETMILSLVDGVAPAGTRAPTVAGRADVSQPQEVRDSLRGPLVKVAAMADRYRAGESASRIAVDAGVSAGRVVTALRKAGVGIRRGGAGPSQRPSKSPVTIAGIRRTLRAALEAAERNGHVSRNVAKGRIDALPVVRRRSTVVWEPEQVAAFLTHVEGHPLQPLFELVAFAGLRRGELLGLQWSAIDLGRRVLWVRMSLAGCGGAAVCVVCGGEHVGRRLKPPKTDASERMVPLVDATLAALIAHQVGQQAVRDDWGDKYVDHDLVFAAEDGSPMRPDAVTDVFRGLVAEAGLPQIRLHDMRHGAASLMVMAGVPLDTVALILGHGSGAVTRDIYAHVMEGPAREALDAAVRLVRGDRTP